MFSELTVLLLPTGNFISSCEMNGEGEKLEMSQLLTFCFFPVGLKLRFLVKLVPKELGSALDTNIGVGERVF